MSTVHDDVAGAGLRRWVYLYNEFLYLVIALRELVNAGHNQGQIQDILTAKLREMVEATDQLNAAGWRPAQQLAGDEATLWSHAVRYVCSLPWQAPPANLPFDVLAEDAMQIGEAWKKFVRFVARLDAGVFGSIPALDPLSCRPDRLAQLVGKGSRIPPAADRPNHFPSQPVDEPPFVVAEHPEGA
jgi:hypothetical protein